MTRFPLIAFLALATIASLAGCGPKTDRVESREERITVRSEAGRIEDDVNAITSADTAQAEADAIRALRKEMTDKGLTYTIRTLRAVDNVAIEDPSVTGDPVRAHVTIFRGREPVQTFVFVPKDNRNLALLGE